MIRYNEIEQKSQEWHELKWAKIGGTLSKGLFVKSDTLFIDILSQRMEDFEPTDSYTSDAMERGNELEPFALDYLEQYTGLTFDSVGWLQSEENELLGLSPDGITSDNKVACEIKCFGRKKHTEVILKDEIPSENIHQVIHYFTVNNDLEELHFIAFRPEAKRHFIKKVDRSTEINLGTEKKPRILTIQEAVEEAKYYAKELLNKINKVEDEEESKI